MVAITIVLVVSSLLATGAHGNTRLLTSDISSTQPMLETLQHQLQTLEAEVASLRSTVDLQNKTIASLKGQISADKQPTIAFMAIMDDDLVNASSNHIVVFNHVMTNEGNAYSPFTGTFTAPVSGIYFLSLAIAAPSHQADHHMYVYIKKNGENLGYLFFDNNREYWVKRTETVTVHLNKSDAVYVIIYSSGPHSIAGQIHSNLSGFLVRAD